MGHARIPLHFWFFHCRTLYVKRQQIQFTTKAMTMTIKIGDKLPDATLPRLGKNGPEHVALPDKLAHRRL